MWGCGGGFCCSAPQYGWGWGEGRTQTGTHTGTYTRMLHLPFSNLPDKKCPKDLHPPDLLQESLGPFGPEVSWECFRGRVARGSVRRGVPGALGFGLRSVQKVFRDCPRSVKKVSRALRDTLGTPSGASETPLRALPRTRPFSRTPHSQNT